MHRYLTFNQMFHSLYTKLTKLTKRFWYYLMSHTFQWNRVKYILPVSCWALLSECPIVASRVRHACDYELWRRSIWTLSSHGRGYISICQGLSLAVIMNIEAEREEFFNFAPCWFTWMGWGWVEKRQAQLSSLFICCMVCNKANSCSHTCWQYILVFTNIFQINPSNINALTRTS